jgi:hypothetical protein
MAVTCYNGTKERIGGELLRTYWPISDRDSAAVMVVHRILANHAPRESCAACPQPVTLQAIIRVELADNESLVKR